MALLLDGAHAAERQPTRAMMEPVNGLAAFMSTLRAGEHAAVFASRGLCIIENFSPFIFCGPDAAARWEAGFRAHAVGLSQLAAAFGEACDFSMSGNRVYFSLPTTWTGYTAGRRFEEHGAWSFVLERQGVATESGPWRISGYGWGVTAYSETAP